jgi:3-ketosteroid 9alpha-monooxygenase subunit A
VPYASKTPPGATIKSWPVQELNGLIFVWHDRAGGAPNYEIPVLPEYEDPAWGPWEVELLHIKTHPREVLENMADKAHFPRVHSTNVLKFENEFTDHLCVQRLSGLAYPRAGGEDRFELEATYYGPGYHISVMDGVLESRLLLAHTPVDENSIDLRFGAMLKEFGDPDKTRSFSQMYLQNLQTGFAEDIEIWENKVFRTRPALCDGDGPIGLLRKWYRQFYGAAPQA